MLMQCPSREAATIAAKRIVDQVRNSPMAMGDAAEPISMTITLGLARVQPDETLDDVVARADRALYAGKHSGRDRYVIQDE